MIDEADKKYELKDPALSSSFKNVEEPEGYSYKPQNPLAGLGGLNLGQNPNGKSYFSTLTSLAIRSPSRAPDYLNYEPAGRGWSGRMFLTVGTAYLASICIGGTYGFFEGLRTSPSRKFNIRLNSVLNKMGRRGSRFGNAVGCLCLMFSLSDAFLEGQLETDRFFDRMTTNRTIGEYGTPIMAGMITGGLYKSTRGPKTMLMATLVGGCFAVAAESMRRVVA